ncbi:MAG: hypothetical protein WCV86_03620 [Patescibacteria group bacterium]|jgi:cytoskeletal protein CcmA (bactofilin family)
MKKVILFAALALFLAPSVAHGATLRAGTDYSLPADETIQGSLYLGAGSVAINGIVAGDLIAAGGTITLNGEVQGDVLITGGTLSVNGKLGGDVRVAGGNIDINTEVPGDLAVAGGDVGLLSGGSVRGDVLAAGGNVKLAGPVDGKVNGAAGTFTLSGIVSGDVDVHAGELILESGAKLGGNLTYEAEHEATISSAATIEGTIKYTEGRWNNFNFAIGGVAFVGWFIGLLSMAFFVVVLMLLFPRFSEAVIERGMKQFWRQALYGLIFLIVAPFVGVFLFTTVVGWMLGLALFTIYGLFVMVGAGYGNILLGTYFMKLVRKKEVMKPTWAIALLGVLLATFIGFVPVIGWAFVFIFFVAGLGAFFMHDWQKMRGA